MAAWLEPPHPAELMDWTQQLDVHALVATALLCCKHCRLTTDSLFLFLENSVDRFLRSLVPIIVLHFSSDRFLYLSTYVPLDVDCEPVVRIFRSLCLGTCLEIGNANVAYV